MLIAVISEKKLFDELVSAAKAAGQVVFERCVESQEELGEVFNEVKRISCDILVLDFYSLPAERVFREVRAYRLLKAATRIVVVAPGFKPGNSIMRNVFALGIYDIYAPENISDGFVDGLVGVLSGQPKTIQEAWRWYSEISGREFSPEGQNGSQKEKVVYRDRIIGTVVIAVAGTDRGVGCTHTSVSLASFLSGRKNRVAVVELNCNPVFLVLDNNEQGRLGSFRLKGIDFYSNELLQRDDKLFGEILQAGYNFVILDLGQLKYCSNESGVRVSDYYDEMLRADVQVLVSGGALWQVRNLVPYMPDVEPSSGWYLLFNFIDDNMFCNIRSIIKNYGFTNSPFANPFCPDPFEMKEDREKVFS
ncbi:hypothetical protein [Zhaonella formicivorans]|uniref:hypothetical protein n=1 Tax=Zhaonella formicivorans TaxID=2528593 RepID=UPI0010D3BC32|nr:hypothetical protein [Zhaonella formicivorans]